MATPQPPLSDPTVDPRAEWRKIVRVDAILNADYRLELPGGASGHTVTRNLSLGGAQVFLTQPAPAGTHLQLTLEPPSQGNASGASRHKPVALRARVLWQGRRAYDVPKDGRVVSTGVQFEPLSSVVEERLAEVIEQLLWQNNTAAMSTILERLARLLAPARQTTHPRR